MKKLIDAIKQYHNDRGYPPKELQNLVPNYLAEIPKTGLSDYTDYDYRYFEDNKEAVAWYCLEDSEIKTEKGQWIYLNTGPVFITKNQKGAVLVLLLDPNGVIINKSYIGMPNEYDRKTFDHDLWNNNISRADMVQSLLEEMNLTGMNIDELNKTLGPPDGRNSSFRTLWELRINCAQGYNWDTFIYWPTENYPPFNYYNSGWTEKIKNWAYVHRLDL